MVKISGNRVELGEVEHALTRIDGVDSAAVAPYSDDTQTTRLAACVVRAGNALVDPRALRASISRQIPGYMVPHRVAIVDTIPQLPGGKVDRARVAEICNRASPPSHTSESDANELERSLQSIWEEVLGVEHVNLDDDFFEIGGDSMRAARMFVELDRRLGIDRPLSLLAEAPTIASLAPMLGGDDADWDALLAFQTEGSQPPLFVVHDGAGGVLNARGLAAELTDQPIYGLRPQAMNGLLPPEKSIPELAATYVRKIQALYPHGPYLLDLRSLGGVIALDMARQLLDAGEPVALVAMGDTKRPQPPNHPVTSRIIGHRLRSHYHAMKQMNTSGTRPASAHRRSARDRPASTRRTLTATDREPEPRTSKARPPDPVRRARRLHEAHLRTPRRRLPPPATIPRPDSATTHRRSRKAPRPRLATNPRRPTANHRHTRQPPSPRNRTKRTLRRTRTQNRTRTHSALTADLEHYLAGRAARSLSSSASPARSSGKRAPTTGLTAPAAISSSSAAPISFVRSGWLSTPAPQPAPIHLGVVEQQPVDAGPRESRRR